MTNLYFARLPEREIGEPLFPEARWRAVTEIKNGLARREKYYAWRLLERAFADSLGIDIREVVFSCSESGRWSCDAAFFSLSHSNGALAAAVSSSPCGIDIEPALGRWSDALAKRYMTEGEFATYSALPDPERREGFLRVWTAKEAIFKSLGKEAFAPSSIDTEQFPHITDRVRIGDEIYIFSAATEGAPVIKTVTL